MEAPPSGPPLNILTFQKPLFFIPSCWGVRTSAYEWGWGGHTHLVRKRRRHQRISGGLYSPGADVPRRHLPSPCPVHGGSAHHRLTARGQGLCFSASLCPCYLSARSPTSGIQQLCENVVWEGVALTRGSWLLQRCGLVPFF